MSRLDADRLERLIEKQAGSASLLAAEIERARIVEPSAVPADVVTMNSRVRLQVSGRDDALEVSLVYPADADGSAGRISILAPVGSALLGLREGDSISWPLPGGQMTDMRLIEVIHQPERSGDFVS